MEDKFKDQFGPMMPNMPPEMKKGLHFNRTSYWCCTMQCRNCDEIIRYEFDYEKPSEVINAQTGRPFDEIQKVHISWDTQLNGQVLTNGQLQDPENTPEGTKCECFCHAETRRRNMAQNNPNVAKVLREDVAEKLT
jgi:hypothetical protein